MQREYMFIFNLSALNVMKWFNLNNKILRQQINKLLSNEIKDESWV